MPTAAELGSATPLLCRLLEVLKSARTDAILADAYYTGQHPLPFLSRQAARRYRELMLMARTNWPALVVEAVTDRLAVQGFRLQAEVDAQVWNLWQSCGLDRESDLVHTDALVYGTTYAMVQPDEGQETGVRVTPESPYEVAHIWMPGVSPRRALAAIKCWCDWVDGTWRAYVLTVEGTEEWKADMRKDKALPAARAWRRVTAANAPVANPFQDLGRIAIVPFVNRMRTMGVGRSELDGLLGQVDRINTTVAQRLLAGEYAAFRQRWATGLEVPEDDEGNPVEPFNVAVDRLLVSEDPEAKFGSFDVTDLRPYIDAVAQDVEHLAAVSKTPAHYLLGKTENISAEAAKNDEAPLLGKVRKRQVALGESWEECMRLGLYLTGNSDPSLQRLETVWMDPENVSEASRVDALTKMQTLQVPMEALWERIPGVTPTEVARWRTMRGTDTMATMLRTGRVPAAPVAQGPEGTVVPETPPTPAQGAPGAAPGAA